MRPNLLLPVKSFLVPGATEKEFREASRDAVEAAERAYRKVSVVAPYVNIYLDRQMKPLGYSAGVQNMETAFRWRKRAFTINSKVFWGVTFLRFENQAKAEHRSGFKAVFEKGLETKPYRTRQLPVLTGGAPSPS